MSSYSIAYDIFANDKGFTNTIRGMQQTFKDFRKGMQDDFAVIKSEFNNIGKDFTALGKSMSLKVSAPLGALSGFAIKSYAEMEQLDLAYTRIFMGNKEQMMAMSKKFSRETALSFKQVGDNVLGLAYAGAQLDKIMPMMQNITTAVYGAGGGQNFDAIMTQMQQAFGRGYIMPMEIRLVEAQGLRGFGDAIAQVKKTTRGMLMEELSSKGHAKDITKDDIAKAFQTMANDPRNKNALRDYAMSTAGSMDLLAGSFWEAKVAFGELLVKGLNLPKIMWGISDALASITGFLQGMPDFAKTMTAWGVVAAIVAGPLLITIAIFKKLHFLLSIGTFGGVISDGTKVAGMLSRMFGVIKNVVMSLFSFRTLFQSTLVIVRLFTSPLASIIGLLRTLRIIMMATALANPYTAIIAGIMAVMTLLFGYENVLKAISTVIKFIANTVVDSISWAIDKVKQFMAFIQPALDFLKVGVVGTISGQSPQNDMNSPKDWKTGASASQNPQTIVINNESYFKVDQAGNVSKTNEKTTSNSGLLKAISNSYNTVGFAGVGF